MDSPMNQQGQDHFGHGQGDVHDIGKNIVKMLLENYNYEVLDLGRMSIHQIVVAEAIKHEIKLIGLSALMTTTVRYMEETIVALKKRIQISW